MQDPVGRGHQRDVALPEDQVAAFRVPAGISVPTCCCCRSLSPGIGGRRRGTQAWASPEQSTPCRRIAAPDIGRAMQEHLGHRDRILGGFVEGGEMGGRHEAFGGLGPGCRPAR
jgi:hypothetical protein